METKRHTATLGSMRWLPLLVGALGIAISIGVWASLVAERRAQIRSMAADVAVHSRTTVARAVGEHVSALRNLAGFWGVVGRRPVEEWRADVELVIENYPNLLYIAWIYPDGKRVRVAAGKQESVGSLDIEPGEGRRLGASERLVGPERSESGALTFRVFLPVRRGAVDLGVLEARVNAQSLLAGALAESAPGYAIRVSWAGEELFARGEPSRDPWQRWWREEREILLPYGTSWMATHVPTPELATVWLDPFPHYLLVLGIALSLVMGALTHQLRQSFLRTRFLAAGNEALEESTGTLRSLNEALEARVQERTQELEAFTHSISHDLKSPLGAIQNFAAILELDYGDRPLDEEGKELLGRIRNSATRGAELLEGLLRLTRAGRADLAVARIDMTKLARESFGIAQQWDVGRDVEFLLDPLPDAWGDTTLVREVWINLLDNALKYSRNREKRRVSVRGRVEDGHAVYEVEDNGQGFDMRHAGKLFGLFERLPSSRGVEGTGVGLAVVERILRRHEGSIRAEGRTGEGSVFAFTLPSEELSR